MYRETHHLEQLNQEIEDLKRENRTVKADCEIIDIAKKELQSNLAHSESEINKLNKFIHECDFEIKKLKAIAAKNDEDNNRFDKHFDIQHHPIN